MKPNFAVSKISAYTQVEIPQQHQIRAHMQSHMYTTVQLEYSENTNTFSAMLSCTGTTPTQNLSTAVRCLVTVLYTRIFGWNVYTHKKNCGLNYAQGFFFFF